MAVYLEKISVVLDGLIMMVKEDTPNNQNIFQNLSYCVEERRVEACDFIINFIKMNKMKEFRFY